MSAFSEQAFEKKSKLDIILLGILFLAGSHAWIYPADVQTQVEIEAPFQFQFQIFSQLIGILSLFRLGFVQTVVTSSKSIPSWLLLILGGASYFWSVEPYNTFGMARAVGLTLLSCMYFGRRMSAEDILKTFSVVIACVIIFSVILAIASPYGRSGGVHLGSWRGLFSHKNGFGEAASIAIIFFGSRMIFSGKFISWSMLLAIISFACCLLSNSANSAGTALVGLVVALIFKISTVTFNKSVSRKILFFTIILSVILFIYFVVVDFFISMGGDLTFTGRTRIWQFYMNYVRDRPFLGWGWTSSSTNDVFVENLRHFLKLPFIRSTHSVYVAILVELGYIGLFLYTFWLIYNIFGAFSKSSRNKDELSLVCGAMCFGMMTFGFFEVGANFSPNIWMMFVVIAGVNRNFFQISIRP